MRTLELELAEKELKRIKKDAQGLLEKVDEDSNEIMPATSYSTERETGKSLLALKTRYNNIIKAMEKLLPNSLSNNYLPEPLTIYVESSFLLGNTIDVSIVKNSLSKIVKGCDEIEETMYTLESQSAKGKEISVTRPASRETENDSVVFIKTDFNDPFYNELKNEINKCYSNNLYT